jgi:hypothetical protein
VLQELGYADLRTFKDSVRGALKTFTYSTPPIVVAATTRGQDVAQVNQGITFWLTGIVGTVLLTASATVADPMVTPYPDVEIIESASGSSIQNRSNIRAPLVMDPMKLMGNRLVRRVRPPHPFAGGSVITVVVNNISASGLTVEVGFTGYEITRE